MSKNFSLYLLFFLCTYFTYSQVQLGSDINGDASSDQLGWSTSISDDGTIVAAGASGVSSNTGYVKVFNYQNNSWSQLGNNILGDNIGDYFGHAISLSDNGTIIAIGAYGYNNNSGLVKVYKLENNSWSQLGSTILGENIALNLTGTPQPSLQFGFSLDLNSDGTVLVVGAPKAKLDLQSSSDIINCGVVGIYKFENNDWVLSKEIFGEAQEDHSGNAVGISDDGSVIAIGAYFNDGIGNNAGHVRIYQLDTNNGNWNQYGDDIEGEAEYDLFGISVDVSGDKGAVAIGATSFDPIKGDGSNEMLTDAGLLTVYEDAVSSNNKWFLRGSADGLESIDQFGHSVAIDDSGWKTAAGSIDSDANGDKAGQVRLFSLGARTNQIGNSINGEASGDQSGFSISMSGDGKKIVIGAPFNDGNGGNSGHIRIFNIASEVLSINQIKKTTFNIFPNPASSQITLQLPKNKLQKASIYNNLGQLILQSTSNIINTSTLSSGIYFVTLQTQNNKLTKKLVIK